MKHEFIIIVRLSLWWSALFFLALARAAFLRVGRKVGFWYHNFYTFHKVWFVYTCGFLNYKVCSPTPWPFGWVHYGKLEYQCALRAKSGLVVLIIHTHHHSDPPYWGSVFVNHMFLCYSQPFGKILGWFVQILRFSLFPEGFQSYQRISDASLDWWRFFRSSLELSWLIDCSDRIDFLDCNALLHDILGIIHISLPSTKSQGVFPFYVSILSDRLFLLLPYFLWLCRGGYIKI